jgi:hypothetical protein
MMFKRADGVRLQIPRTAIEAIFDECDRYNVDETGGRILGTYQGGDRRLGIAVRGVIEPGPSAQRSQTYFKQDGDYQETVFRKVEDQVPEIEHLGNWHTHHVNGLHHLSGGDIETYFRTVNHPKHNTDFFYALLVTERVPGKSGLQRYIFKNYVMRRNDDNVYEIPASAVTLVDAPLVWPVSGDSVRSKVKTGSAEAVPAMDLVHDQDVVSQFFPKVKMLKSAELGIYWRGSLRTADGAELEVVVLRDSEAPHRCEVTLRNPPDVFEPATKALSKKVYPNARSALIAAERACNAQLVATLSSSKKKRGRLWMF